MSSTAPANAEAAIGAMFSAAMTMAPTNTAEAIIARTGWNGRGSAKTPAWPIVTGPTWTSSAAAVAFAIMLPVAGSSGIGSSMLCRISRPLKKKR